MKGYVYIPTVLIQLACSLLFGLILYSGYFVFADSFGALSVLFILQTLVMMKAFTPVHEGSHGLLSPKKWLNEILFFLLWPLFPFGPHLFRMVHSIHHSAVGKKGIDPDLYTLGQNSFQKIVRCLSMIFHCLFYILWRSVKPKHISQKAFILPKKRYFLIIAVYVIGQFSLIAFMFSSSYALPFLMTWLGPSLVSIAIISYFDAVLTHENCSFNTMFESANIVHLPSGLRWILCDQNYHFVHHYRPSLPWYQYRHFWRQHHKELAGKVQQVYL